MAIILIIESSTEVCSVALSKDNKLIDIREDKNGQNHARLLTVFMDELLQKNKMNASNIDAIAVSKGPGSYTGLRIGVSVAKGFCYANQIPLIAVSTLEAMSTQAISQAQTHLPKSSSKRLFCPMMDARRMEVYTCLFDEEGRQQTPVSAEIINDTSFADLLQKHEIIFFGNGSAKCQSQIKSSNAIFLPEIHASASFMQGVAFEAYKNKQFEDIAYFEPFYLKDFVATVPKNNVLGK